MKILCRVIAKHPGKGYHPPWVEFEEVDDPDAEVVIPKREPLWAPQVGDYFEIIACNG